MSDYIKQKCSSLNQNIVNLFYKKFVIDVKKKLDKTMVFLNKCLEEYYKHSHLKHNKNDQNNLGLVKSYKEKLLQMQNLDLQRFKEYIENEIPKKEYMEQLKEYIYKHQHTLKNSPMTIEMHPDSLKTTTNYKFQSELFEKINFCEDVLKHSNPLSKNELNDIANVMIREKHYFSGKLYEQMILFSELMRLTYDTTTSMIRTEYHSNIKERYFHFIESEKMDVSNYYDLGKENPSKANMKKADELRASAFFKNIFQILAFQVENKSIFQTPEWNPFFFEETYEIIPDPETFESFENKQSLRKTMSNIRDNVRMASLYHSKMILSKKQHLIVLVHGHGGTHKDMRIVQNFISKIIPHSVFLTSKANEKMTEKNISLMGEDLSKEILEYTQKTKNISKISFVGHSLGGIIIRTALQHLQSLRPYFFTYVSLSSPHLGCKQNKSFLINVGMSFMEKFSGDKVIEELQMNDRENLQETFLYKLSLMDKLSWFNNIILLSSPQDLFVPYSSARIQPQKPDNASLKDRIIYKMAENIWKNVSNDMIVRLDVDIRSEKM